MATQMSKHKLVFLGDVRAGKTSIINRFVLDTFNDDYVTTLGIDFLSKTVHFDNSTLRFQLWDTAGEERFRSLIPNYIRDSSIALIVFDVTNKQTFDKAESYIQEVKNIRGNNAIIVLVGNKIDNVEERCVSSEEAATKATEWEAVYIEVSARSSFNITNLFNQMAGWLATRDNAIHQNVGEANKP